MSLFTNWRKPKEQTVSRASYDNMFKLALDLEIERDAALNRAALADEAVQVAEQQIQQERNTIGNMLQRNRELQTQLLAARAEAEANKVDAEAHRERLRRDREYHQRRRQQSNLQSGSIQHV